MCWMCDSSTKGIAAQGYVNQLMGISSDHYKRGSSNLDQRDELGQFSFTDFVEFSGKGYDGFFQDGVGDGKVTSTSNVTLITGDNVAGTIATTSTLQVGGPVVVSTIDTLGDDDFFKVELVEGRTYDFSQFLTTTGPNRVPLADAFLELYDATGKFIVSADGGGPNTPSGLDAVLTFTAKASGTYYINAKAYDDTAVGDYEISVQDVTDRPSYKPYYDVDSPLHSIDWGSQVDRTSRNPDGEEGPRVTGNAFTGVGSNPFGIEGKNVITVYFAKLGDIFVSENPANPGLTENIVAQGLQAWEKKAFLEALGVYEEVADVVFVEVQTREEADFKIITYEGTPGVGASLLGRMSPPNEQNEGQTEFNSGDSRWTEEGLQKGGFYFPTLLHEFGHGMGLAHPHDNGGRSSVMRGAGGGTGGIGGGLGDFGLSQQVFTVMSYNDGWETSGYGNPRSGGITGTQVDHFGWVGSLSPLDIAVIQDKYGVNEDFAKGDDTYVIKDYNGKGNYYSSIWDAGGTDEIVYGGTRNATIDLRAATLKYEEGGGGRVSHAFGLFGGFTIANGVTIENARSGAGNDKLFGNEANNVLDAGSGNDTLNGGGGDDILVGGLGKDALTGGAGADVFRFQSISDSAVGADRDTIADFERGIDKLDLQAVGAKTFVGSSSFSGSAGEVRYAASADATIVELDADGDGDADFQLEFAGSLVFGADDFIELLVKPTNGNDYLVGTSGGDTIDALSGNDTMIGLAGDDNLSGGAGSDLLIGGAGKDVLTGGSGSDVFRFDEASDSRPFAGRDVIRDFQSGIDQIDVSALGISTFIGRKSFTGEAGELRFGKLDGKTLIEADLNGDKVADFQIELFGSVNLAATDFLL